MITRPLHHAAALALLTLAVTAPVHAQQAPGAGATDTLTLRSLHRAALRQDPRARQLDLLEARTETRLRAVSADRLPTVSLHASGQYQSDAPSIPFGLPGGAKRPTPPLDSYDSYLMLRQSLYDPSVAPRLAVESARGAQARAEVATALYELKQRVNDAFFGVLLLRTQAEEIEAAAAAVIAHLEVVVARVKERAVLPSEEAVLRRELLRQQQILAELREKEAATRERLELLTGVAVPVDAELRLPELADAAAVVTKESTARRSRPEYERFESSRTLLDRQAAALSARLQPTVSAFGRGGYGRPGLNPLATEFDSYWLAGVQVAWTPWQRGTVDLEREELVLQREILQTEEEAFTRELEQAIIAERAEIEQLEAALARDDEIVALSEEILDETRVRFAEAVTTSAELLEDESDLLRARLDRASHTIQLARARARLLMITGHELP